MYLYTHGHGFNEILTTQLLKIWTPHMSTNLISIDGTLLNNHYRKILWGAKIQQSPPSVTYEEAMGEDERGLFKWLSNIVIKFLFYAIYHSNSSVLQDRFGFSFISGVPKTPEATEKLTQRIGFIRETQCSFLMYLLLIFYLILLGCRW